MPSVRALRHSKLSLAFRGFQARPFVLAKFQPQTS
jgi:hypothetical protein